MKITVYSPELKRDINIALPTSLICSEIFASIIYKIIDNKNKSSIDKCDDNVGISRDTVSKFLEGLREFHKNNRDFVCVDLQSADGERIKITL